LSTAFFNLVGVCQFGPHL